MRPARPIGRLPFWLLQEARHIFGVEVVQQSAMMQQTVARPPLRISRHLPALDRKITLSTKLQSVNFKSAGDRSENPCNTPSNIAKFRPFTQRQRQGEV